MKKMSVKTKITLWLTWLMALLAAVLLIMILFVGERVVIGAEMEQLSQTVDDNLKHIEVTERMPKIGQEFSFYKNGVTTLVYSKNETLLAGQIPLAFTAEEAFQNGLIRIVDAGNVSYLVMDVWLPSGWENGIWIRGLMEAPNNGMLTFYLMRISAVVLPVFMLLAALGSFFLIRRAFRPLDRITAAAEAINEARDLSGRIGLPPGGDEFSRLAADYDQMFERLERSFEAEKQFTSDASHELRTPVAIIKGACEYAEKYNETPEEWQESIEMIRRQAEKMSDLITQLLNMTRIDQGTEAVHMEKIDLSEFLEQFCREQNWDPSRIHLEALPGLYINADWQLLGRLVLNLVENGIKYGKTDGNVWITTARMEKEILLSVRDDGIGIPAEEQDKIWKRFYQIDSARSGEDGAGLGLAMVQQIAKIHDGAMSLESVMGEGSTFTLHLPADESFL